MYQGVVFFDFESFFLANKSGPSHSLLETLNLLKQQKFLAVILANLSLHEVQKIIPEEMINSYVLFNGQVIIIDGRIIYEKSMNQVTVNNICAVSKYLSDPIFLYAKEPCVFINEKPPTNFLQQKFTGNVFSTRNSNIINQEIYFLRIFFNEPCKDFVYETFLKKELTSFRQENNLLEIGVAGHSFERGIQYLLNSIAIEKNDQVYAVSDSLNRVKIFEKVQGISTKKAPIRVQLRATYCMEVEEQLPILLLKTQKLV